MSPSKPSKVLKDQLYTKKSLRRFFISKSNYQPYQIIQYNGISMWNIVLCGYTGKTGSVLLEYLLEKKDINMVGLVNSSSLPLEETIKLRGSNVVIDFTTPRSGYYNGIIALNNNNHFICGTTGLTNEQIKH